MQMATALGIIGFSVGVINSIAVFTLVIGGKRRTIYQAVVARHPWIHLLPAICIGACGGSVAYLAYGLAQ